MQRGASGERASCWEASARSQTGSPNASAGCSLTLPMQSPNGFRLASDGEAMDALQTAWDGAAFSLLLQPATAAAIDVLIAATAAAIDVLIAYCLLLLLLVHSLLLMMMTLAATATTATTTCCLLLGCCLLLLLLQSEFATLIPAPGECPLSYWHCYSGAGTDSGAGMGAASLNTGLADSCTTLSIGSSSLCQLK